MKKSIKIWLIAATSLLLIGCIIFVGVMINLNWDFTKLSTVKYETNNYEFNDEFKNIIIAIDTADIVFVPTDNTVTKIVCFEESNSTHSVKIQNGSLVIEQTDTRKWYEHIGINFSSPQITVYLPKREYENISIKTSTGDIKLSGISADSIELGVSTGDISLTDSNVSNDLKVKVTTGNAKISNVACKNIFSDGDTGDITLNWVIATDKFSVTRDTGDINLDSCDSAEMYLETDTGNIKGSLLSEKIFITKTNTGKINVPKSTSGGICKITTHTGDIKITTNLN